MGQLGTASPAATGATGGGPDVTPGTIAAWAVSFREDTPAAAPLLTVGSETYDGSVAATLPAELAGGSYQVVIEGMTDEDYAKIRLPPSRRLAVSLYLWWKDSPSGILGDLARITGLADPLGAITPDPPSHSLVADLRVESLRRRAGERRYEVVMTGRERVAARLEEAKVTGQCYAGLEAAVRGVARAAGIAVVSHGLDQAAPTEGQPDFADTAPGSALDAISTLAGQAAAALKLHGLPVALIRDGVVHVGKWNAGQPGVRLDMSRNLDESSGLVSVNRGPSPGRATVTVTTLGRPDLKPGDRVAVPLPPEDFPVVQPTSFGAALLTSVTGPLIGSTDPESAPSSCLIREVTHQISRRQGFVTSFQAIVLGAGDDGWDAPPASAETAPAPQARSRGAVAADPAAGAATALNGHLRHTMAAAAERTRSRIGQVRDHEVSGDVPLHTSNIWYSTAASDGLPVAAQRTAVTQADHGELREAGTRVLLANAGGGPGDVVDLGSVWPRDAGPPAEPADYWLVLPAAISEREHLASGDGSAPDGPASHDLIDADGARLIETTRFVIRVTDDPTACTSRPETDAPDGSVLIETRQGTGQNASIRLDNDGTVTISAASITFDTAGRGDITLKADNVKVQVSGTMDVS